MRDEKSGHWLAAPQTQGLSLWGKQKRGSSKLTERRANIYENKGPPWKTRGRSGNVHENTDT